MRHAVPKACAAATALLATGPAAAREAAIDPGVVEDCFAGAAPGEAALGRLGAAAGACSARPGWDTTVGIVECIGAETATWDAILNREHRAAREAVAGAGTVGIDIGQALLGAQRARIAHRDAECAPAYALRRDGTIRSIAATDCALDFTASRAIELRDMRGGGA